MGVLGLGGGEVSLWLRHSAQLAECLKVQYLAECCSFMLYLLWCLT